jgi:hypothetical protein
MERRNLVFFLREYQDVLELGIKAFGIAREKILAADFPQDERAKGVSMLEGASERAMDRCRELAALLRWLETPAREVPLASLPGGREDRESTGYVGLDELTARLLSGGDR